MNKFIGFSLIRLNKAVGLSHDITTHSEYDVTIHNVFGKAINQVMKIHKIDADWCKLRMLTNEKWAVLKNGMCYSISEEEYMNYLDRIRTIYEQ